MDYQDLRRRKAQATCDLCGKAKIDCRCAASRFERFLKENGKLNETLDQPIRYCESNSHLERIVNQNDLARGAFSGRDQRVLSRDSPYELRNWKNPGFLRPCYIFISLSVLTVAGSLIPAVLLSTQQHDIQGGFSIAQYILGVGVLVIGCGVAIHSRTCTCWLSLDTPMMNQNGTENEREVFELGESMN